MKFSFRELLLKLLWKLSSKKVNKALTELDPRVVKDAMRQEIEKWSDSAIDQAIKNIKEGNLHGFEYYISAFEKGGMGLDVMLQWFEEERFLREHRRKYHAESK